MRLCRIGVAHSSVAFGLLLLAAAPEAATLRVPSGYPSIQAAIDAAVPGDSVLVAPGTYPENLDTHGKRLTLASDAGAPMTIVDGDRRGSALVLSGGGTVDGLTFRNGEAAQGGGINASGSSGTIRNSIIEDNAAVVPIDGGVGGGIYLGGEGFTVVNCTIRRNFTPYLGGGIADLGHANEIRGNFISGNHADLCGAGIFGGSSVLFNLIIDNLCFGTGAGICDALSIESNTIADNRIIGSADGAAGIYVGAKDATIRRNIIANNHGGIGLLCLASRSAQIECNDSWGNDGSDFALYNAADTTGGRNFSLDPLSCSAATGDYHIAMSSPCAPSSPSGCDLVGVLPPACSVTPARRTTWGALKALYRQSRE